MREVGWMMLMITIENVILTVTATVFLCFVAAGHFSFFLGGGFFFLLSLILYYQKLLRSSVLFCLRAKLTCCALGLVTAIVTCKLSCED